MDRLINQPFHSMNRFLDMLCLNLGNNIDTTVSFGGRILSRSMYPEYSLHIQVQWRFVYNNKIILGSRDIYTPFADEVDECDWDYEPLGRPDDESSVFDVVSKNVVAALTGHHITQCISSPTGDIQIEFSNGYIFEVFIPASTKHEMWRLIDFKTDEHLIFFDAD